MTVPEPVLLKQYKLIGAVIDAPWATRLDHKIARHVIDRYYVKFGNSRASLRYLEKATGATRSNIIESIRRVIDNGVIKVIRQGIGTRPTEYDLNFDFVPKPSSGTVDNTSTSGIAGDTPIGIVDSTSSASSGIADGTESYLRNMSTDMLTVSRIEGTPAVPTAPPVFGLEADQAASAVDPGSFEELWNAFPRKHQRAKAKAAYKALAPDRELHGRLVASAIALADHHRATGTEPKWFKHLHTWLSQESYLEDLPIPYENPKDAAIARARERGPRQAANKPSSVENGLSPKTPIGHHQVVIIGSDMPDGVGSREQRLCFLFRIQGGEHDGREFSHTFLYGSNDANLSMKGETIFAKLCGAAGKNDIGDTSDLHDRALCATVSSAGRIQYAAM